ncbi:hypothetical protein OSJ57_18160 [Sphingomonas sp. HH69]
MLPIVRAHAANARGWRMILPDDRTPVIEIEIALPDGGATQLSVDPATGA